MKPLRWTLITTAFVALIYLAGPAKASDTLGPHRCPKLTSAPVGKVITGRVVHVVDADTLDLASRGVCVRVRLTDFDAPERGSPSFTQDTARARRIVGGKVLTCRVSRGRSGTTVSYGRALARCSIGGQGLGDTLRRAGVQEGGR